MLTVERSSLLDRLHASVRPDEAAALGAVTALAEQADLAAYLVGGVVRDLLLGRASPDLDVTVEGDAPALAHRVASALGLPPPLVHPSFGTATVHGDGYHLDLITARREVYDRPGALPRVTPAALADDLARRDVTINAIAIGLTGAGRGALIDPHGGVADLERRLIRTLHARSFIDDATRLLRVARYLARFRFELDSSTAAQAHAQRGYLTTISPARVRHEFVRTFAEEHAGRSLAAIDRLRLGPELASGLRFGPSVQRAFGRWRGRYGRYEEARWLLPIVRWPAGRIDQYADRFELIHAERRAAHALPEVRSALDRLSREAAPPSAVVAALDHLPPATVAAFAAGNPRTSRARLAARYLDTWRGVRPLLTSAALRRLGLVPGPRFGEVLRALRAARLDQPALTLDDERALVQHMLEQQREVGSWSTDRR
jgi:tRNA nucleotidyltransferase (CCA-adding enzyme)